MSYPAPFFMLLLSSRHGAGCWYLALLVLLAGCRSERAALSLQMAESLVVHPPDFSSIDSGAVIRLNQSNQSICRHHAAVRPALGQVSLRPIGRLSVPGNELSAAATHQTATHLDYRQLLRVKRSPVGHRNIATAPTDDAMGLTIVWLFSIVGLVFFGLVALFGGLFGSTVVLVIGLLGVALCLYGLISSFHKLQPKD